MATSRGLLPLRASLRQPGRPRVLLTSFSRGGGPAQPTLCLAQKKIWRSGRREPRQLSTAVDRFDGFDGSLDGPMGDGRPPQTPPPGLEPASTRSNQALRTALQARACKIDDECASPPHIVPFYCFSTNATLRSRDAERALRDHSYRCCGAAM